MPVAEATSVVPRPAPVSMLTASVAPGPRVTVGPTETAVLPVLVATAKVDAAKLEEA